MASVFQMLDEELQGLVFPLLSFNLALQHAVLFLPSVGVKDLLSFMVLDSLLEVSIQSDL